LEVRKCPLLADSRPSQYGICGSLNGGFAQKPPVDFRLAKLWSNFRFSSAKDYLATIQALQRSITGTDAYRAGDLRD